jgi:hypothetical protein
MYVTRAELKSRQQDYFLAQWVNGALSMVPHCHCGEVLNEKYFCESCNREGDPTFLACEGNVAFSVAQRLIQGNPSFRDFGVAMLEKE